MKTNKLAWALGITAVVLWAFTYDVGDGTVFELDGNAITTSTHDWDQVFNGTSGALATSFDTDKTNDSTDDIFQAGGSKDTNGLQEGPWLYTGGKPQGKDDIAHSYAAAYFFPAGCGSGAGQTPCHLSVYFGADRYDNSGDATMGFWFFQDSHVGLGTTKTGGGLNFTGVHKSGDILVVADFSIGGSISTPTVYKWVGDDATGSLQLVSLPAGAAKVEVNGGLTTSPWPFKDKSGNTQFAPGEFMEGGLDLTAVFGGNIPCITTFMAETRSSTSPTATLSDFTAPHSLPLCGITITKTCTGAGSISADGNSITYNWTGTVHNDGIASLSNITITDTLPDNTTSNPTLYSDAACTSVITSLGPNTSATATGHYCVQFVATKANVSNPLSVTNAASVSGQDSQGDTISSKTPGSATCTTNPSDSISIFKQCGQPYQGTATPGVDPAPNPANWTTPGTTLVATGGMVEVNVNFSAKVCNTGASGTAGAIGSIAIADYPSATGSFTLTKNPDGSGGTVTSLAPGACAFTKGTYIPSAIDGTSNGKTNGRYTFSDQISVTSATPTFGTLNPVAVCHNATDLACSAATCAICFGGSCQ
jgi:uncharacterized repeat protein (TIGR01451 family)